MSDKRCPVLMPVIMSSAAIHLGIFLGTSLLGNQAGMELEGCIFEGNTRELQLGLLFQHTLTPNYHQSVKERKTSAAVSSTQHHHRVYRPPPPHLSWGCPLEEGSGTAAPARRINPNSAQMALYLLNNSCTPCFSGLGYTDHRTLPEARPSSQTTSFPNSFSSQCPNGNQPSLASLTPLLPLAVDYEVPSLTIIPRRPPYLTIAYFSILILFKQRHFGCETLRM